MKISSRARLTLSLFLLPIVAAASARAEGPARPGMIARVKALLTPTARPTVSESSIGAPHHVSVDEAIAGSARRMRSIELGRAPTSSPSYAGERSYNGLDSTSSRGW